MKNPKYSKTVDWVFLFAGLIITALVITFSALSNSRMNFFDGIASMIGGSDFADFMLGFGDKNQESNLYLPMACYTSLICWGVAILYYWIIDRFHRWWHWSITVLLVLALAPIVTYSYIYNIIFNCRLEAVFTQDLVTLTIVNTVLALVLYIIVCFSVKRLSAHCSTTPF